MKQVLNFDGQVYWSTNKERGLSWAKYVQPINTAMRMLIDTLKWSLTVTGIGLFMWLVVLNHLAQWLGIYMEWLKRL